MELSTKRKCQNTNCNNDVDKLKNKFCDICYQKYIATLPKCKKCKKICNEKYSYCIKCNHKIKYDEMKQLYKQQMIEWSNFRTTSDNTAISDRQSKNTAIIGLWSDEIDD